MSAYRPSPRPTFDRPTAIPVAAATRHVWGDQEAGEVADWIYASTDRIHCLVFGLPPGGAFRHSRQHPTVFAADEVLAVLQGVMALANPETGEVVRVPAGEFAFFRRDTWHHAFAHGTEPLRVLELFAPPPAAGASGAYARTRPYLERSVYADDAVLGELQPGGQPPRTLHRLSERDAVWRRALGVLEGLLVSTEHLTAGVLEVDPGHSAALHRHGGDEVLYLVSGSLDVRATRGDEVHVLELAADGAAYVPAGWEHEYRNWGGATARAVFGVAPSYPA
jgi:mannose-6-phosphate isomerase-like protein (cupin superfamily)